MKKIILTISFLTIFSVFFIFNVSSVEAITTNELQMTITKLQQQILWLQQQLNQLISSRRSLLTVISPNGGEKWLGSPKITDTITGFEIYRKDIKWIGAPDDFDSINNGRILVFLEKYENGQYKTVGRIPPFGYGSLAWVVGVVSKPSCDRLDGVSPNGCFNYSNMFVVTPGQYFIRVMDTFTGAQDRSDAAFTIIRSNLPDLTISNIQIQHSTTPQGEGTVFVNQEVEISFDLVNQGNSIANPAEYKYISVADGISTLLPNNTCYRGIILKPGQSCKSSYSFKFPTPGIKELKIMADPENKINEIDENNNIYRIIVNVISTTTCMDSDGGRNYYIKGTVTDSGKTYTDYCINTSTLKEYFCLSYSFIGLGGVGEENYTCPYGCQDGVCKSSPAIPSITLLSPNGGETLIHNGPSFEISWKSVNAPLDSYVQLRRVYDLKWGSGELIASNLPTSGSYLWVPQIKGGISEVPNVNVSGDRTYSGYIEVDLCKKGGDCVDMDGTLLAKDFNDKPFRINTLNNKPLYVKVVMPNGGETLTADTVCLIRWESSEIGSDETVEIGYRPIDRPEPLGDNIIGVVRNTGTYYWRIPKDLSTGQYKLSVHYKNKMGTYASYDYSDQPFKIIETPITSITVISPNGGEIWTIGSKQTIRWSTTGSFRDNVVGITLVSYEKNVRYWLTPGGTPNDGIETIVVPAVPVGNYVIEIAGTDIDGQIIVDTSDKTFQILSSLPSLESPYLQQMASILVGISNILNQLEGLLKK